MITYTRFLRALILTFVSIAAQPLWAAPAAQYWGFWDISDESSVKTIDHSVWDRILSDYTVADAEAGLVNFRYGDLSKADLNVLKTYVRQMEKMDPRAYTRIEQKAYWMNMYNALSVLAVVENFDKLKAQGFSRSLPVDAWDKKRIKVAKQKLSLNDIEHRILRPIWKDHRVLFGLNCASRDCPNLPSRAFTASNIKVQLKEAGSRFINNEHGLRYADGVLHASRMFRDYLNDFAADERTLTKVFAHYARDMKALYVLGYTGSINYTQDTRLNIP